MSGGGTMQALEMEYEEDGDGEERESLLRETSGGANNGKSNNGHASGGNGPPPKQSKSDSGGSRKTRTLFGLAAIVSLAVLYAMTRGVLGPTTNMDEVTANQHPPGTAGEKKPKPSPSTTPKEAPSPAAGGPSPSAESGEEEEKKKDAMVYSRLATIVPDPERSPLTDEAREALAERWGSWHFWDGDEDGRPSGDYCAAYPNRDVPGDEFPDDAWQVDAVFVNHLLNDAEQLVARAMEAIFAEYGRGKPLPPEGLAERLRMFHWEKVDLSGDDPAPPQKFTKRGDRGNGGWTTKRSVDGLVRRLLHAIMTNDTFTVVMAGHSAAAGHGNHFHQSYMMQFHRIMAPVFARLGVKLITRNHAQGGLGTLHNAMGAGSLYGGEIDLLLWDSGMTEKSPEQIDLFLRQGLLGGNRVPVVWGGRFDLLAALHQHADADVGEYGTALDGVPEVESEAQARTLPYASRFMKCQRERQDLCAAEPRFCAHCWIERGDLNPKDLFDAIDEKPAGQVKWHPGWRHHQLLGRLLAFTVLDALQQAIQIFSDGTMGGPPLDDDWWHVTDYYENIRTKLKNMDPELGACHQIQINLPQRMCTTPMKARSMYTPRANPHETSITSILKPAPDGYIPVNEAKVMYDGPDVHNPCYDIPADGVDVLAVVSGRRRKLSRAYRDLQANITARDVSPPGSAATQDRRLAAEKIVPGRGWQVVGEPPGDCDGEYNSICGRQREDRCPLYGHHDSRGAIVGNELSGWLVMELADLKDGIIVLKLGTGYEATANTRTKNWKTVNNEPGRQLRDDSMEQEWDAVDDRQTRDLKKKEKKLSDLPDTFQFEYAINGDVTTLSKQQFMRQMHKPQRTVEVITLLDDPNFTKEPMNVEVAFRMKGCRRACTFGLSHVYWA